MPPNTAVIPCVIPETNNLSVPFYYQICKSASDYFVIETLPVFLKSLADASLVVTLGTYLFTRTRIVPPEDFNLSY